MQKHSAALAAALFTVFGVAATDVNAQSPRLPGSPGPTAPGPRTLQPGPQPQMVPSPLILPPGVALMVNPDSQPVILEKRAVVLPRGPIVLSESGILILPQGGQLLLGPDKPPLELPAGIAIITLPKPDAAQTPGAPGTEAAPPPEAPRVAPSPRAENPSVQEEAAPAASADSSCGPAKTLHDGLARVGEKPLAAGVIENGDKEQIFIMYGDREGGSWTIVQARLSDNFEACVALSGENLKLRPAESRLPGIPVSLKVDSEGGHTAPSSPGELEYMLGWKFQQSLQITGESAEGQIRLYANTSDHTFTVVAVKGEKARIVVMGDKFKDPETLARIEDAKNNKAGTQPAPAFVPAPAPQ